jgi:hypothetical protein
VTEGPLSFNNFASAAFVDLLAEMSSTSKPPSSMMTTLALLAPSTTV